MNTAGPPEEASTIIHHRPLSARDLEAILDVTKGLAEPAHPVQTPRAN